MVTLNIDIQDMATEEKGFIPEDSEVRRNNKYNYNQYHNLFHILIIFEKLM